MIEKISLKRVNRFLLLGILLTAILYFAKQVLIPVSFAIFFAMLFTKLSNKMETKGINRAFSALISVLMIVVVSFGIGCLVFMQAKSLSDEFPEIEKKSQKFMEKAQNYVSWKLDVPKEKQDEMINKKIKSFIESSGQGLKDFFAGFIGILGSSVMVLLFTFLFLYQREKYESFFLRLCDTTKPDEAKKLIHKISAVSQNYLTGRALSILIFTALFTTGFLIIGLKGAFLLAFIAALLTIIPYIGSIIGGLFPFAVALVTEDSTDVAIGALAVIGIIQAIDNYFIEPYIIGGEVNISAFFTILILLIGGLIWGVAGMILFLPMLGVAKIVFDNVPELNAYGYLIGDQQGEKTSGRMMEKIKGWFKKK
ncbi:MAG: AI-2E family transporter [Bacteroidota bacterium]|nr:AI-2E family transporter [Bacteroidota bacterium]